MERQELEMFRLSPIVTEIVPQNHLRHLRKALWAYFCDKLSVCSHFLLFSLRRFSVEGSQRRGVLAGCACVSQKALV